MIICIIYWWLYDIYFPMIIRQLYSLMIIYVIHWWLYGMLYRIEKLMMKDVFYIVKGKCMLVLLFDNLVLSNVKVKQDAFIHLWFILYTYPLFFDLIFLSISIYKFESIGVAGMWSLNSSFEVKGFRTRIHKKPNVHYDLIIYD